MLRELERKLSTLSHSEDGIIAVKEFAANFGSTQERLSVFNANGAMVRTPIRVEDTRRLGFTATEDEFTFLQGDVVTTESAYFLGERVIQSPKYVVLNSSCDLIEKRREYAALLRIREVRRNDPEAWAKLSLLLQFKKTDSMYLPVLPPDKDDVVGNVIQFDGICQIRSSDLALSNRIASLSLVGWRIFASFTRIVLARASPRESEIRNAIEQRP